MRASILSTITAAAAAATRQRQRRAACAACRPRGREAVAVLLQSLRALLIKTDAAAIIQLIACTDRPPSSTRLDDTKRRRPTAPI